jgi:arginyl-tRNA synthetase
LSKGVLEIGEGGAVVYHGEKDGLHTRVFRNKLGLPTYEAKELGLAVAKYERYKYDQSVVVTANEITEYFRVILSVMGQLYPELAAKTIHKPHGIMKLKSGKMSSRTGKVVTGEGLLDDLAAVVLAKMGARDVLDKAQVADKVAVAALKYTVLKQAVGGDIVYEPETMTNLEGDTGPYLLYAYARAKSVLGKVKNQVPSSKFQVPSNLSAEESAVIRYIYRYPEVVASAAKNFAPHMICSYLNELARRFNSFYAKCRIADAEDTDQARRIMLTQAVAQVLSNGLDTLGIATVEEM